MIETSEEIEFWFFFLGGVKRFLSELITEACAVISLEKRRRRREKKTEFENNFIGKREKIFCQLEE